MIEKCISEIVYLSPIFLSEFNKSESLIKQVRLQKALTNLLGYYLKITQQSFFIQMFFILPF